jgi:hypothetical protein
MINELFIWAASAAAAGASGWILAEMGWLRLIFSASVPVGFMVALFLVSRRRIIPAGTASWRRPGFAGRNDRRD